MMAASLAMCTSSIGAYFAPSITVFSIIRTLTAASVSGLFQTGYILGMQYLFYLFK